MEFLDSRPEGLYRIKGFVDFGAGDRDNTYALHAVGRFLRFGPRPWKRDEPRLTQLVLIGSGIDPDTVHKELVDCRESAAPAVPDTAPHVAVSPDTPKDAAHEQSMWGVLRYVQQPDDDA